ncbi:MAG: glycine cleavage system aminomethyltransferase GcvT [Actinomycetia bacterium]|nr:glycine cleavage system aminomethyltransferase GcvT [Actinomycetes bacterium]
MPTSPLHEAHERAGARFTDFGGWTMPVQYQSVLEEHAAVRSDVGMFDVSHLGRFEVVGAGSTDLLVRQLCNDIRKIDPGRAQYTMALNASGGVEDDIIVWRIDDERYWVMPNGTNFDEIASRFVAFAPDTVSITDLRVRSVLLAIQGPRAADVLESVLGMVPGRFRVRSGSFMGHDITAAGTGYTGEKGAEVYIDIAGAEALWEAFTTAGAKPAALGARDTLRLEMGYPLWGHDLDDETTPLEANLAWVVSWDHDFIGRDALEAQRGHLTKKLVSFTTEGRAIPREGYAVTTDTGHGTVTSGNFSPTLQHGIGMAFVSPPPGQGESLSIEIRGRQVAGAITSVPFLDR